MEKMFRDMDQQFNQDATVLRNAIKELKVRAGDVRPASTGTFIGWNYEVVVKFFHYIWQISYVTMSVF